MSYYTSGQHQQPQQYGYWGNTNQASPYGNAMGNYAAPYTSSQSLPYENTSTGQRYTPDTAFSPNLMQNAMAGISPEEQALLMQLLSNPNAGDMFNGMSGGPSGPYPGSPGGEGPMLSLPSIAGGVGAGVLIGKGMMKLFEVAEGASPDTAKIVGISKWIDNLPGVRQASEHLEKYARKWTANGNVGGNNAVWKRMITSDLPKEQAVREMLRAHTNPVVEHLKGLHKADPNVFGGKINIQMLDDLNNVNTIQDFRDKSRTIQKSFLSKADEEQVLKNIKNTKRFASWNPVRWFSGPDEKIFGEIQRAQSLDDVEKILRRPSDAAKAAGKLSNEAVDAMTTYQKIYDNNLTKVARKNMSGRGKNLWKSLWGLKQRFQGLDYHFKMYAEKAVIKEGMMKKGVNPIGRMFGFMANYVKNTFSGATMGQAFGSAKAAGILAPALSGALVIGTSLQAGMNAEPGEKFKTFAHDFLKYGLGGLIGWEVSKGLLENSGSFKFLGRWASKIGLRLPALLGKFSLGGIAIQMAAMFVFSWPFQKAFEKVSHWIFGKPKAEEERDKPKLEPLPALNLSPGGQGQVQASNAFNQFNQQAQGVAPGQFVPSPGQAAAQEAAMMQALMQAMAPQVSPSNSFAQPASTQSRFTLPQQLQQQTVPALPAISPMAIRQQLNIRENQAAANTNAFEAAVESALRSGDDQMLMRLANS